MRQYVGSFTLYYDVILHKLIDYLFENQIIEADSKYTFTQFCILRTLFDFASDVVNDFQYTPEQLVDLIDSHKKMTRKFESMLKKMIEEKDAMTNEVLSELEDDDF